MSLRIDTVSASGRIVAESDNAHVLVIEFRARSDNSGYVYVGDSGVTSESGREIAQGETFTLNFALPDIGRHAGRVLLSSFYVSLGGGDKVDWTAIIRDPAA